MMRSRLHPVVMCGGSGTRLWPASRPERPKQFLPLTGPTSMFQQAVGRVAGLCDTAPPIIVCSARHIAIVRNQLDEIGLPARILAEPAPRDSAPAIAAAALLIAETDPDGIAVVVAADHQIPDTASFQAAAARAAEAARTGLIVTLGVRPTAPSSAYGYIRPVSGTDAVPRVAAFVEKPDTPQAAAFIEAGYLWNSGNFVFAVADLLAELDRYAPGIMPAVRAAMAAARHDGCAIHLGSDFRAAPKISIDYAVMEHTQQAAVLPVDLAWSDLGAWDAVWDASEKDTDGNCVTGAPILLDSVQDCILRNNSGRTVAIVGAQRLAVIVEPEAILVCQLDHSQTVKAVAERAAPRLEPCDLSDQATRLRDWLRCAALPVWWTLGADHAAGGFHEALGQDGAALAWPRRLRVQARQAWVYAQAAAAGWPGPWHQAADHGLAALAHRYRRSDGLYRTLIDPDGAVADDTALLYDQAFVLLVLALPHQLATTSSVHGARALFDKIETTYGHSLGGFREASGQFLSNPLMHLLEACLAWAEHTADPHWDEAADRLVGLAMTRLIDQAGGFVREHYGADWTPAQGDAGRVVEPGHQFEWAWLLQRWAIRHGDGAKTKAAHRLFAAGVAGIDPLHGAVVDQVDDRLQSSSGAARLWPQTEYLKAALILAQAQPMPDAPPAAHYLRHAAQAASTLWSYLDRPIRGLWHDKLLGPGEFVAEPSPASSLYHLTSAIQQLSACVGEMGTNGADGRSPPHGTGSAA